MNPPLLNPLLSLCSIQMIKAVVPGRLNDWETA